MFKEKVLLMPDGDIFNKRFAKGWAGPARKICKGARPEIAADQTARALRRNLKKIKGIQNLSKFYRMIIKAQNGSNPNAVKELFRELERFERCSQNRDVAAIIKKAIWQTYLDHSAGNFKQDALFPAEQEIAERICYNCIETQLHSKIEIAELENTGQWHEEHYQQEYKKRLSPYIKEIAKSLAKAPDFSKPPRFSKVRERKLSTEEILHKPISLTI